MFTPAPGSDHIVRLPLKNGKNSLLLSLDGTDKNGKIATDKDRLVFDVGASK